MRKSVLILLAVILLSAGGYSAFWYKKSGDIKRQFTQMVESLNDHAKPLTDGAPFLRYDSVAVSGFPFSVTLEIKKPVMTVPVSALLRNLPHSPEGTSSAAVNWLEEISYSKSLSLSTSVTGDTVTLIADGDRVHKSIVNGAVHHTLISSSAVPLVCHLGVKTGGVFWSLQTLFDDPHSFFSTFRRADCAVRSVAMKDVVTGTLLFSADNLSASASSSPSGEDRDITFKAKASKARVMPAYDTFLNDYEKWRYDATNTPAYLRMTYIPYSQYGEQDLTLDLHYNGPVEHINWADPAAHMMLDINTLDVKNALSDSSLEAHISTAPQAEGRVASIVAHARSQVTPRYDQLLAWQLAVMMIEAEAQANAKPVSPNLFAPFLTKLGKPEEVVTALLPKFHEFGPTTLDIDATATGPNDRNFFARASYNIRALDWMAQPYGITFTGSWIRQKALPSGEFTFTCLSCDRLVGDLGGYSMRVETIASRVKPERTSFVTPNLVEGVRQFLHGLAENSTAKDLVIRALFKDTGEITLSGKPITQVMQLFSTTVLPNIPKAAPAAAPAQPAPPVPPVPASPPAG